MSLSPTRHHCIYRRDQRGIWHIVTNYWILPVHFLSSVALATTLLSYIDNRLFLIDTSSSDTPPSVVPISQTDFATLLSLSVTTVRTLTGAWLTLTGWRLAFIILELEGMDLKSFSRLVCYRVPPKRSASWRLLLCLWTVFLISAPVQFVSPLVTGAVSWNPDLAIDVKQQVNVTHPGNTPGYRNHQGYSNSRFFAVIQGFALSTLAATTNFSVSTQHISRRRLPSLRTLPTNSTLGEVSLPYLHIEDLKWIKDGDDISPHMDLFRNITSNPKFDLSLINEERTNPYFHGGEPGRVVIAYDTPWQPEESYPDPKVARGTRYVIVSSTRRESCDDPNADSPFGALPSLFHYDARTGTSRFNDNDDPACYVIARMTYTAGVWTCRDCLMSPGGIVETSLVTGLVEPDPLAEQALRMTPDVLSLMITSYSWKDWIKPDNLDNYTKGMLLVAYQACWNALANVFSEESTFRQTSLSLPYPVLRASIIKWRVWVWLLLNCLLTLSGLIVVWLQKETLAKTVRNPELSVLLLDTKQIIEKGTPGLCNAVKVAEDDNQLVLKLRCPDSYDASYQHPYVEVQGYPYHQVPQEHVMETLSVRPK